MAHENQSFEEFDGDNLPSEKCEKSDKLHDDATTTAIIGRVSITALFRHSSCLDKCLTVIGLLSAIIGGLCMPFVFYIFGLITNSFVCFAMRPIDNTTLVQNITSNGTNLQYPPPLCEEISEEIFLNNISTYAGAFAGIGAIQFITGYVMMAMLTISAENQLFRVRCLFLKSFLRQDMEWFDKHRAGEFASRAADDLQKFKDGIGDKVGMATYYLSVFAGCLILSLAQGWKLSLVVLSVSPLTVISGGIAAKVQSTFAQVTMQSYAHAGNVAEEVISSIRTVLAFGGQAKEIERYETNLSKAESAGIKSGLIGGFSGAVNYMIIFLINAIAFWYGIKLIVTGREEENPEYTPANFISILQNLIVGTFYIGQITPHLDVINTARCAVIFVFQVIDRVPIIDSASEEGLKPVSMLGNVKFCDVHFDYPSRPGMKILQGLELEIKCGETVALVGESGCGKSTTIQLLQRFYDPMKGIVKIDDNDVKSLNVGWLRKHIGVVGQEPVLFEASILENIKHGRENAEMEDVVQAAKQANVHNFVMKLPQQYQTMVGERGAQLSGGQKQRIAIARALIRNPKILLLDEATSALDSESESLVQNALEKAAHGRTTILIAHRLSTVRNANKIVTISKGRVVEMGTHDELMKLKGTYFDLVVRQAKQMDLEENETLTVEDDFTGSDSNFNRINSMNRSQRSRRSSCISRISQYASFRHKCVQTDFDEEDEKLDKPSLMKLLKMNSPEWVFLVFGAFGSLLMGCLTPGFSIVFGEMFGVMSIADPEASMKAAVFYACLFVAVAVVSFLGKFLENAMFAISGEKLTTRLRKFAFTAILRQEIGWFDDAENSTGALCSRLATDAANVQGAAKSCSDAIIQSICTMTATIIISLVLEWRLGLLAMAFLPLIMAGFYMQKEAMQGHSVYELESLENANKKAIEAISNLKTVASLHRQQSILQGYSDEIGEAHKKSTKSSHINGLMFGFSQSMVSFAKSALLYYGGTLVVSEAMPYKHILTIVQLMIMASYLIGQVMSFIPNYTRAITSAARIFKLLERQSEIDSSNNSGIPLNSNTEMRIQFQNVHFNYPTRPANKILQGLNLVIPMGKITALVGGSGCGKSTCIQLLQRFYDTDRGNLLINDTDIKKLNIQSLRSYIGIVSQEPILFDRNIAENIAYGDNSREVPMDEIFDAARRANIHEFISTLPQGYNTGVGARGLQLSGGQKQRIAIARALVRNPQILLLDEATSALDAENEMIVQKTLEEVQKGRTCITIAHRLTTIKNADNIVVLHLGKVVETGTHEELLKLKGHYYRYYET